MVVAAGKCGAGSTFGGRFLSMTEGTWACLWTWGIAAGVGREARTEPCPLTLLSTPTVLGTKGGLGHSAQATLGGCGWYPPAQPQGGLPRVKGHLSPPCVGSIKRGELPAMPPKVKREPQWLSLAPYQLSLSLPHAVTQGTQMPVHTRNTAAHKGRTRAHTLVHTQLTGQTHARTRSSHWTEVCMCARTESPHRGHAPV